MDDLDDTKYIKILSIMIDTGWVNISHVSTTYLTRFRSAKVLCYTGSWDPANTNYRETDGKIQAKSNWEIGV